MTTVMAIGLYCVGALVICALIGALYIALNVEDFGADTMSIRLAHPGLGGIQPSKPWPRTSVMSDMEWSYPSAYNPSQDVFFNDPSDAYEYVVEAVKNKNLSLDRLESSRYRGMPSNYEWLWIDTHIEREYWLTQLAEFKEDV